MLEGVSTRSSSAPTEDAVRAPARGLLPGQGAQPEREGRVDNRARELLDRLLAGPGGPRRLVHLADLPPRPGRRADWPEWVAPAVRRAVERTGVESPWTHQAEAADAAWRGEHVVLATGTASGKSLAYQLPGLTRVLEGTQAPGGRGATVLYLSPTKALAADQARTLGELAIPAVRAALLDGDTPPEERTWVREHAAWVLTNPDMLHVSVLPDHARWAPFLRSLTYVVVDECHTYRGVFGSGVAAVLRRLRRVCARYGSAPVFVLASATTANPAELALALTGLPHRAVTDDGAPRGGTLLAFWEPPPVETDDAEDEPRRRSAGAESADLLADVVSGGARGLAFVRSRKQAEAIALQAARVLEDRGAPHLVDAVAAYRSGYLPEERRSLEADLQAGRLRALASTPALELGVNVRGMDAVVVSGWPGTHASLWQQSGRAGRDGRQALAVLVAGDDPLDAYLVHHPSEVLDRPLDATVLDPANPYVLAPHLCAAAAELPLCDADATYFGPEMVALCDGLVASGALRRRSGGWYWTRQDRPASAMGLRGSTKPPVRIVEQGTGRLLGTVEVATAPLAVHAGAIHLHRGESYLVDSLDLEEGVALVHRVVVDWTTVAHELSDIRVVREDEREEWGAAALHLGMVDVTSQVVSFARRRVLTGEHLGVAPLDLPAQTLRTRAVWWTQPADLLTSLGIAPRAIAGAAHAAEHAAIGMLRLVATCDRWDIGGVSTALHEDTGECTVFEYDGHPGGAGFSERGYVRGPVWLRATREAIASCECATGCPSCVQSPKCGNGNEPLDKVGAVRFLDAVLASGLADGAGG